MRLKAAVDAVEAQTVRFSYRTEVRGGAVSPAEGVADRGGQVRLTLTPAAGFRIAGFHGHGQRPSVDSFAIEGSDLVLTGVQSRQCSPRWSSPRSTLGTLGEGGDGGHRERKPRRRARRRHEARSRQLFRPLATTGADGAIGLVWTGLALTLLAAGTWLFHLRRRSA